MVLPSRQVKTIFWMLGVILLYHSPIFARGADLDPTLYIDSGHPKIISQVKALVGAAQDDVERAVRIHDFVRDHIVFGWAGAFYDQKASEVLASGIGYCNTKSTLFVAMLRAAGIPAKQHFVNINSAILEGILNPGTPYVDHSYTEVFLRGKWLKLDSYIVDTKLANAARRRLQGENRLLGYGVHRDGVSHWDGLSDAFSQYLNNGSIQDLSTKDFGVYEDIAAFYRSGQGVNELSFGQRLVVRFYVGSANRKAQALRDAVISR